MRDKIVAPPTVAVDFKSFKTELILSSGHNTFDPGRYNEDNTRLAFSR